MPPTRELRLLSRRGCHLCELMIEELVPLCRDQFQLTVLDVDSSPAWQERYGLRVPVLLDGDRVVCEARLDRTALGELLAMVSPAGPAS